MARKQRTDAERRLRQCERLSRLLRTLHLIMGSGRWSVDSLAEELECSRRTVYRDLQTLSMAGVPWYLDAATQAYRVRPGYRFTGLESLCTSLDQSSIRDLKQLLAATDQLVLDGERFVSSIKMFGEILRSRIDDRG